MYANPFNDLKSDQIRAKIIIFHNRAGSFPQAWPRVFK